MRVRRREHPNLEELRHANYAWPLCLALLHRSKNFAIACYDCHMPNMKNKISQQNQQTIRRLLPVDLDGLRRHLKRLDEDSRQLRFGAAVSDGFLDSYAEASYRLDTLTYGLFVEREIRAIGELRMISFAEGGKAEIAFSVEKDWQNHGIGSQLMERIVRAARTRGISHLTVFCLPGNEPMRHLAEKFGAHVHSNHGELAGEISPPPPTPFTYLDESLQEARGVINALFDQAGRWTEGTHR